jgi:6-phosphofructokinase 1
MVDVESESYTIARRYMIRLSPDDLSQPQQLSRLAATAGLSPEAFRIRFEYLVAKDL